MSVKVEGEQNAVNEQENFDVEESWQMFKSVMVRFAEKLCGVR